MSAADDIAQITRRLSGITGRDDEDAILATLESTDELGTVLDGIDLEKLVSDVDSRREQLLTLLTQQRRGDLAVPTLAALARALMTGHSPREHEAAFRDIAVSLTGTDLRQFKSLVNNGGDFHDLEMVVYAGIDDEAIRQDVLDHFAREVPPADASVGLKILSDIDDTVWAAIHDDRYPKGMPYPGYEAFVRALDAGHAAQPDDPGDLTFITARPWDPSGWVEGYTRNALSHLDIPQHSVLTGSIFKLVTKVGMKEGKLANFERYRGLFPEADVVFLGDSGQADIEVGLGMIAFDKNAVKAVFIHDVVATAPERRTDLAAQGVWLVDTYAGAALKARELGLITAEACDEVVKAVRTGLIDERISPEHRAMLTAALDAELSGA